MCSVKEWQSQLPDLDQLFSITTKFPLSVYTLIRLGSPTMKYGYNFRSMATLAHLNCVNIVSFLRMCIHACMHKKYVVMYIYAYMHAYRHLHAYIYVCAFNIFILD